MPKFKMGSYVNIKDTKAIGKVIGIDTEETLVKISYEYKLEFLEEGFGVYFDEDDLVDTKEKEITNIDGVDKATLAEKEEARRIENEKREKTSRLINGVKAIKERFAGNCKDGEAFWKLYNEELERFVKFELEGVSPFEQKKRCSYFYDDLSIYMNGFNFNQNNC